MPVGQPPFINEFGDGFLRHLGRRARPADLCSQVGTGRGYSPGCKLRFPGILLSAAPGHQGMRHGAYGERCRFAPGERISVEQAIALYTSSGAYASFEEHLKGTITPGKLADFAVLGADPRAVDPERLDTIPVLATIRGGAMVYEAPMATRA